MEHTLEHWGARMQLPLRRPDYVTELARILVGLVPPRPVALFHWCYGCILETPFATLRRSPNLQQARRGCSKHGSGHLLALILQSHREPTSHILTDRAVTYLQFPADLELNLMKLY